MTTTAWPFIEVDAAGVAWIAGTRIKVIKIVMDHVGCLWNAEQIQVQYPHLSLSQIHAALGMYYENKEGFDQKIVEDEKTVDDLRRQLCNPKLQEKLRQIKAAFDEAGIERGR